jgi:hypothetical protein
VGVFVKASDEPSALGNAGAAVEEIHLFLPTVRGKQGIRIKIAMYFLASCAAVTACGSWNVDLEAK